MEKKNVLKSQVFESLLKANERYSEIPWLVRYVLDMGGNKHLGLPLNSKAKRIDALNFGNFGIHSRSFPLSQAGSRFSGAFSLFSQPGAGAAFCSENLVCQSPFLQDF